MRSRLVSGGLLIFLGLLFLAVNRLSVGPEIIVAIIGSAFLVWFAYTQEYGLLIPGAILTGLGLGIVVEGVTDPEGGFVLLGLSSGFLSIYVVDRLMGNRQSGRWWPLIPGGILFVIGFSLIIEGTRWWAVIS